MTAIATTQRVAAIVLAAGTSSRMGTNKLLLPIDAAPMLSHAIDAALYSQACRVLVVVGHDSKPIVRLCSECTTQIVHNADYASGMASSIRAGIDALPADVDAALIMLGDMPFVTAAHLDLLIGAHGVAPTAICVPQYRGQRGNPLLWPRRFFPALQQLSGDTGARTLLNRFAEHLRSLEFDSPAVLMDCDTPESLPGAVGDDARLTCPPQSKRY